MAEPAPIPEGYEIAGDPAEQIFVPRTGFLVYPEERLSTDLGSRVGLAGGTSFITFGVIGMTKRYSEQSKIFRAENAHRLPRSERGWFFYHRAKSLYALSSAMQFGPVFAFKMMWIPVGFVLVESAVDHARGNSSKDFLSTVTASMSCAGVYSLLTRQAIPETSRLLRISLKFGLTAGILQDFLNYQHGRRLFYVDFLKQLWHDGGREKV